MVETSPLTGAAGLTRTVSAAAESEEATNIASDFETFLKLLTTQMRNQDPLKPLESTEFVAQLATFSSVEQQVAANKHLSTIETLISGGAGSLAGWLGAEVEAPMPLAWDGAPVQIRVTPEATAERAYLVVRDAEGASVHREAVEPALTEHVWTGDGGSQGGLHGFEIEYWAGEEQISVQTGRVFAEVVEARPGEGGAVLMTGGGVSVEEGAVTAVRSAGG